MATKLKSLLASVLSELKDIWNRSKMYLIGLAVILATLEWRKIKDALIVAAGAKEIKKDTKVDGQLAAREQSANQQADALVAKANQETAADDWNKK